MELTSSLSWMRDGAARYTMRAALLEKASVYAWPFAIEVQGSPDIVAVKEVYWGWY